MIRKSVRLVIASAALLPAWAALAGNLPGSFSQINLQGGGYYTGMVQHWSGRLIGRTDGGGVYLSDNGGFLWQYLSGNMYSYASMCVAGIAVPQTASSSSNVILQVVGADWSSLLTDTNRGIWLTTNGGA